MATTFKPNPVVAATSILTTELNSLANAAYSNASAAIDNTVQLCFWMDLELQVTYGTGPTVNLPVEIYLLPSLDGTNYPDGGGAVAPATNLYVGSFILAAVTTAQRLAVTGIPVPPSKFKLVARNGADQTMAASGNIVRYTLYNEAAV